MAVWAGTGAGTMAAGHELEHGTMAVWDSTGARYHGCVGRHWSTVPWLCGPALEPEPWLLGPVLELKAWLLGVGLLAWTCDSFS